MAAGGNTQEVVGGVTTRPGLGEPLDEYLRAIVGGEPRSSFVEVRPIAVRGGAARGRAWLPVDDLDAVEAHVRALAASVHVYVGVAPRLRSGGGGAADVGRVWCLWADCDDRDSVNALRAFRPVPSIVVRSGSGGVHGYWPLAVPLEPAHAQRANRRLALALGADMNATDPARILRPPGTLNFKHDPPRLVSCARLGWETFTAAEVVSGLLDSAHYLSPAARAAVARRPWAGSVPCQGHAEAALEGLCRTVAQAAQGGRNHALFWACCRAFERVDSAQLVEGRALDALSSAALEAGLGSGEIRATIASARRTARGGG